MKTVVITGSARGFGLELAKEFKAWTVILAGSSFATRSKERQKPS